MRTAPPVLRGWIPVAVSAGLPIGDAVPLRLQGDDLVLWRAESGTAHALEAFCQHLGAHLGYGGRVRGEDIRCFYHGWTWSPEGENTDIPYDTRVHKGRRIRRWYTGESGGLVFVWHPGGGESGEPARPAPTALGDAVGEPVAEELVVDPRLIVEAFVDPATVGLLLPERVHSSEVAAESDAAFRLVHRYGGSGQVEVTVADVASLVVRTADWTLTVGILPLVDDVVRVYSAWAGPGADAAGESSAVRSAWGRILGIAADTRYRPLPAVGGAETLRAYRAWFAGLDSEPPMAPEPRLHVTA